MPLTSSVKLAVSATQTTARALGTAEFPFTYSKSLSFANGTGANQANEVFADQRTLAASATENLDLAGVLTNGFGTTITFTKIKAIIVFAASANTNDVVVGGALTNAFASPFGAATDKVKVKPGGMFMIAAPDATGLAVTATTADILLVANGGAGTSVIYDVVIIGVV